MNLEHTIAHDLLSIGAVFLRPDQPFTWASGIKSPIYCDNRLTLTAPAVRTHVEEGLADLIRRHYPAAEVLMGTSTAGIAHAAIVGHLMGLPMGYVRSGSKDHGRQNQIEGVVEIIRAYGVFIDSMLYLYPIFKHKLHHPTNTRTPGRSTLDC